MTRRNWITGLLALITAARAPAQAPDPMEQQMREAQARLRAAFPYPVTTVPGTQALAAWERIRAEGKGWPVIVGDDEGLYAICDQFSMDTPSVLTPGAQDLPVPPVAQVIATSRTIAMPRDLANWNGSDPDRRPASGPWPDDVAAMDLTVATNLLDGRTFARVHIVTLPTAHGWEVPAYLRWGNWNGCPPPAYQCAALRGWQERHGAELVGINRDTINLRVKRRPTDGVEALAVASECYAYCPDTVDQGVGTIEALAATLMASDWWFFWWD
ncbi:DUF4253 domain-containing protein [Sphingomonas sp. 2R-10]|uniref:DUF4253 domain-containing protein n=1 Tax=Sphingomonas sp. 2R-10 TaxID=3045148 RepID=UPI000F7952AF|nr:DUF4253 domain-containing protein [Sphingomonas sp. 2R-10]MDJ0276405.1 DUF4253 domain-containing protein [Sphingomonas sp. 2R-10]